MNLLLSLLTQATPAALPAKLTLVTQPEEPCWKDRRNHRYEAVRKALQENGPQSVAMLAELLQIPRQTLYKIIVVMEANGIVRRGRGIKIKGCLRGCQIWSLK